MTTEITDFIQSQGRALSLADLDRLIADLLALLERFEKIYLPFLTMSCNGEPLRILIEISDRVMQSPRTSPDIVLCLPQAVQEGEESVARFNSDPAFHAAGMC